MTLEDKSFFAALGLRIAQLRKDSGYTQVQLAEHLAISQQHMASFEKGIRKIPASMLPKLAQLFGVSLDELMDTQAKGSKRGPASKLERQIERIQQLPRTKQRFVTEMLDTVIQQAS